MYHIIGDSEHGNVAVLSQHVEEGSSAGRVIELVHRCTEGKGQS